MYLKLRNISYLENDSNIVWGNIIVGKCIINDIRCCWSTRDIYYLEVVMEILRQDLEEGCPVRLVGEPVVKDASGLMSQELGAVLLTHNHRLVGLEQALDHLGQTDEWTVNLSASF